MIRGKKILGALLAFTLCFSMVIPAQADNISDAKKKQQELEQQKNTAEAEKSELSSELDSIVSKMEKTQSDLTAKETEMIQCFSPDTASFSEFLYRSSNDFLRKIQLS